MMKETPIIFNMDMVRAILDGRKTQTRGVVKGYKPSWFDIVESKTDNSVKFIKSFNFGGHHAGLSVTKWIKCPYGKVGDRLWVRETWADVNTPDGPAICYRADGSYQHWRDFSTVFDKDYGAGPSMNYEAYPGDYVMWWEDLLNGEPDHRWKPSIHMPKWACRTWLEITNIRVERLQDINYAEVIAEGFHWLLTDEQQTDAEHRFNGIKAYSRLWDSIYGKKYPWEDSPWVWVIEFKRIDK